ncbi:hypothetical protein JCM8547_008891, partial [Rhodosporidiobolus lusitaniae]
EAGTQRAFQSLPRHLRRRAASHNIRRLPTRLRKRALAEVPKDAAKPKRVTRSMLGKHRMRKRPGLKAQIFLKRQQKKIWLETHVWHAKRMHMTEIWGHRLAEKPTAKAFRASYRAAQHGALVHDASYYQYLELSGPIEDLEKLLEVVCDPSQALPTSKRYSSGAREYATDIYDSTCTYPRGLLGPATFIWKPVLSTSSSSSSPPPPRTLLLRLHPALASSVLSSLRHALTTLRLGLTVSLKPLERAFLTFEITGSRSTEVLKKCLRVPKGTEGETKGFWRALGVRGPGEVGRGMVVGMEVHDPRLSFPPKLPAADRQQPRPEDADLLVPSAQLASVPSFWDEKKREEIREPRYRKADLDARRAELLIPGISLTPLAQDNRIPALLSQFTLSPPSCPSASSSSHDSSLSSSAIHGWRLTLPSGWGMPFLSSLAYSTPRLGGLRERSQTFFEAGAARFPEDYPGTKAFGEWEERREGEEKGYWERRPPGKRESWGKLGTRSPWRVGMEGVLKKGWAEEGGEEGEGEEAFLVPVGVARAVLAGAEEGEEKDKMVEEHSSSSLPPRQRAKQLERNLLAEWRLLSASPSSSSSALPSPSRFPLLRHAMVRVRLTPIARGKPEDLALIYEFEREEEAGDVLEKLRKGREEKGKGKATGEWEGAEDLCARPKPEQLIGRVTSGGFTLSEGKGGGLAVLSMYRLKDLRGLVLFRNRGSEMYRAATIELH